MTQSLSQILQTATRNLSDAGCESASLDARLLLQHAIRKPHEYLISHSDEILDERSCQTFETLVTRRATHEPVAYITGSQDFWKDTFSVTPDTLIPRADSETILEACLELVPEKNRDYRILDMGTGSGCLILSLLREYEHAHGTAIDMSENALAVAKKNAKKLSLENRVQFFIGDMCDETSLPNAVKNFDIIVCNPPYICTSEIDGLQNDVKNFEPLCALDGGMQGINFYKSVFNWLPTHMHAHSVALFEVGHDQAQDVATLANQRELSTVKIFKDIAGTSRVVTVAKMSSGNDTKN